MNPFLYFLIIGIWGTTWIAIKNQVGPVAFEVSIFYRFALAASVMFFILLIKKVPFRYTLKQHVRMALLGLFLFSCNFYFFYHAAPYLSSGLMAILFSSSVIMIMLNSAIFLKKPITFRMAMGATLGILGLCCVFLPELRSFNFDNGAFLGLCLGLVGAYCFSIANQISHSCQKANIPLLASTFYGMVYGCLFLTLLCVIKGIPFNYDPNLTYTIALLHLAIPGSVIGFITYLSLVNRIGPEKAVYTTLFFPIVALIISTLFESFTWVFEDYLGVAMILFGNALVLIPQGSLRKLMNRDMAADKF